MMEKEIEAKFINIDKEKVINCLEEIGAKKLFDERLLRRCVYNLPIEKKGSWARVRDEVDRITLTYKRVLHESLDGVEEVELVVNDFEKARMFLKAVGLIEMAYQESKRIRFVVDKDQVVFDIDTWPGLEPWIEIEAKSEEIVKAYAQKLGFNWEDAMFGSADLVYARIYKVKSQQIIHFPRICFDDFPEEFSEVNKRNPTI